MRRRILISLPFLFVAWIVTLAVVMRVSGDAPAAFVPFPRVDLLAGLPDDVALIGRSSVSMTFKSTGPDLVSQLYAAGALLVLPAGLESCIPRFMREDMS